MIKNKKENKKVVKIEDFIKKKKSEAKRKVIDKLIKEAEKLDW